MELNQAILITVIGFMLFSLYKELLHPAATFLIGITILVLTGILTPGETLKGFSNPQIAIIILLLTVTSILKKFKATGHLFEKVVPTELPYRKFLLRMLLFTSTVSSFLNNTPVVATLIPYVHNWCKNRKIPPSKILIPLSYAAIMGGTITLIGTSTNLVVNALYTESGFQSLKMFDFTVIGLPAAFIGIAYLYFIGYKLLPFRKDVVESFLEKQREYIIETIVNKNSRIIGKTVKEANLRNLRGLFLAEIIKKDKRIFPVSPEDKIEIDDILIFVGETKEIINLVKSDIGISMPSVCLMENRDDIPIEIVESVVPYNSSFTGKKVKDTNFRAKYDGVILAVHRNGEKLSGKIGEIVLKPGDLLLIMAGNDFWKKTQDTNDVYITTKITELLDEKSEKKGTLMLLLFIVTVLLSAFNIISLFNGLLLLISVSMILKVTTYGEIKKSIDINTAVIAALSIAVGYAMVKTGLANVISEKLIETSKPLGITFTLLAIYLITNILTEFITNIAAASITFPIAISTANSLSLNPKAFVLAVAFAASASFLTPIGYQTNLMVFSIGNYKFSDFLKVGLPLAIIYCLTIILMLKKLYL